jgi:hypothetical protein
VTGWLLNYVVSRTVNQYAISQPKPTKLAPVRLAIRTLVVNVTKYRDAIVGREQILNLVNWHLVGHSARIIVLSRRQNNIVVLGNSPFNLLPSIRTQRKVPINLHIKSWGLPKVLEMKTPNYSTFNGLEILAYTKGAHWFPWFTVVQREIEKHVRPLIGSEIVSGYFQRVCCDFIGFRRLCNGLSGLHPRSFHLGQLGISDTRISNSGNKSEGGGDCRYPLWPKIVVVLGVFMMFCCFFGLQLCRQFSVEPQQLYSVGLSRIACGCFCCYRVWHLQDWRVFAVIYARYLEFAA